MKNAKHIFNCAATKSEAMIVDRILVRVLPALIQHDQKLTANSIKSMEQVMVPDSLYEYIREVAEELVGCKCIENPGE